MKQIVSKQNIITRLRNSILKKSTLFCFVACMLCGGGQLFAAEGTETDPWLIDEVADLEAFRDGINTGESFTYWNDNTKTIAAKGEEQYFKLTVDLDLSSVCSAESNTSWVSIGIYETKPFKGIFIGNNKTISNLYINAPEGLNIGLFGYIESATIDGLELKNANVVGKNYVGGICGRMISSSSINNCSNGGTVTGTDQVGGICGLVIETSSVNNCTNSSNIKGTNWIGGICGLVIETSLVNNCTNSGTIAGTIYVGGICGIFDKSQVSDCSNGGRVAGVEEIGGICGRVIKTSSVTKSINSGNVTGENLVGGICGSDNDKTSTFANCYYDKQLCLTAKAVGDEDDKSDCIGKNTIELTNGNVFGDSENWTESEGMYPCPKNVVNTDEAIVAATPIFLQNEESVNEVKTIFELGTENNVVWTSKNNMVDIVNGYATVIARGNDTLVATLNGIVKEIAITTFKKLEVNITWENPEAIVVGTALSETQLNAEVDIEGTFVYEPAAGKIFEVGTHTLKVTFTPDDAINYAVVTKEVTIEVKENKTSAPVIENIVFEMYPNPTTNGFYIDFNTQVVTIDILTIDGKLKETLLVNGKQYIDISNYTPGIYMVRLPNGQLKKIVKK